MAAAGFAFYVANFASYNKTYGSLAGVVVGLVFLWLTNVALLLGAEIDSELERGRQLQAGIAAETRAPAARPRHPQHREGGRRRKPRTPPAAAGSASSADQQTLGQTDTIDPTTPIRRDIMKKLTLLLAVGHRLRAGRPRRPGSATSRSRTLAFRVKEDPRVQSAASTVADTATAAGARSSPRRSPAPPRAPRRPRPRTRRSARRTSDELLDQLDPDSTARQENPYPQGDLP